MPKYYFDIAQNDLVAEDHNGSHFSDLNDARQAAAIVVEGLGHDARISGEIAVEIRDEHRELLARVPSAHLDHRVEDTGHPATTTGSGKFQQPVLRGDNRMHLDPNTKLPTSPEVQSPNGGAAGTNAQTADLSEG